MNQPKKHFHLTKRVDGIYNGAFYTVDNKLTQFTLGTPFEEVAGKRYDMALYVLLPYLRKAIPHSIREFLRLEAADVKPFLTFDIKACRWFGVRRVQDLTTEQKTEAMQKWDMLERPKDGDENNFLLKLADKAEYFKGKFKLTDAQRNQNADALTLAIQAMLNAPEPTEIPFDAPNLTKTNAEHVRLNVCPKMQKAIEGQATWLRLTSANDPAFFVGTPGGTLLLDVQASLLAACNAVANLERHLTEAQAPKPETSEPGAQTPKET